MIDHFISTLPERPYCGTTGAFLIRERDEALKFPLIQYNHPAYRRWIGIDVDQKFGSLAWEDAELPPNLIMVNDHNGHAHYLYNLERPVYVEPNAAPNKPARYLSAVTRGVTKAVGGDFAYNGQLIKNPTHPSWRTLEGHRRPYSLDDLAGNVDLNISVDKIAADSIGRNCALFDSLRRWAYREKNRYAGSALSQLDFRHAVEHQARAFNNQFTYPLPESEVRSTAKSISRWVWNRYRGNGGRANCGIMKLDLSLPLDVRQSLSAKRTNQTKVEKTISKIRWALNQLGDQATQKAVAKFSGVSLRTVATYLKQIRAEPSV